METRLLRPMDPPPGDDPALREAARLLRAGRLVAFPTETVYGLGADATSAAAVESVYVAKGRPADNPCIVHLADARYLGEVAASVPDSARRLADRFWPGPLTLVLPAAALARRAVTRGLDTIAVRVPDHPVAHALLVQVGIPLVAPSANRSGRPSPTRAEHVLTDLGGRIDAVLDGGPCRVGIESTVLDMAHDEPALLRPGAIEVGELEAVLGQRVVVGRRTALARSPGTRYRHYAPAAALVLLRDQTAVAAVRAILAEFASDFAVAWLATLTVPPAPGSLARSVDRRAPGALEHALYDDLRALDREGCEVVFVEAPLGRGAALDRLERASALPLSAADVADLDDLRARLRALIARDAGPRA